VLSGNGSELVQTRYDSLGRQTEQRTTSASGAVTGVFYKERNGSAYDGALRVDGAGNLKGFTVEQSDGTRLNNVYTLQAGEGYQTSRIDVYKNRASSTDTSGTPDGSTLQAYDANGFLTSVADAKQSANNRTFVNDAAGRLLYANQGGHVQRQLIANGQVLAATTSWSRARCTAIRQPAH